MASHLETDHKNPADRQSFWQQEPSRVVHHGVSSDGIHGPLPVPMDHPSRTPAAPVTSEPTSEPTE